MIKDTFIHSQMYFNIIIGHGKEELYSLYGKMYSNK
jgi:hypothetical protein